MPYLQDIFPVSCGTRRAAPCSARLRFVGWTSSGGAAHVVYRGYPGSYPKQDLILNILIHLITILKFFRYNTTLHITTMHTCVPYKQSILLL